ncbi:ligase-associated DNA damage response exonuclease [Paracoccus shanxieyensis]|uniref:Ligase-associated DNA damage response exonuclease n=1 Tax=Paracoccus shanxieyensis TaxID=2675752 RepID=A0A6L6IVZ7_9RHOB|nr:ligase-associated DNA damage response exonuclease [Paracoccus shanxieyensis]MTH62764.1 ligase-associated DNA damage response exonuclease [Paracoccus shanxieyensis]MTH86152.1 ligase-associated DNA damage response exonuclease [Paracoccus shanxieyensis]
MRADQILFPTDAGLYCPEGGFHIDPVRPVDRALITHGHSDHARFGHGAVMATQQTLDIMRLRMGADHAGAEQAAQGTMRIGGVTVSFHPAGHVLGSAQIAVTSGDCRIVVSGDYTRAANPTCLPFQPIPCDVFVTEATFGLPVFRFPDPATQAAKLMASMAEFPDRPHLIGAYALGKAQHVISLMRQAGYDAPIAIHGALKTLCDYYVAQGVDLGPLIPATADEVPAQLVIAPPSAFASLWVQRFRDPVVGFASGWMAVRARARQRGVELPLIVSDHVDWPMLTGTLAELSPSEVWVTHGTEDGVIRWCELQGMAARPLRLVGYEDEAEE